MQHDYDSTGVDTEQKSFELIPDGTYTFKIKKAEETKSSKGHLMAKLQCEVMNNIEFNGRLVFHNVTFIPPQEKGAGMAIHFLKCIQQPWEGKIKIEIPSWEGGQFIAKIGKTKYMSTKTNAMVEKNEIKAVEKDPEFIPF